MNYDTAERLAHAWMTAKFKTNEEAIDALLSLPNALPAAPTANTIEDHAPDTFGTLETPTAAGREDAASWELQTPNLRTRLDLAITKARAAQSPIDRREWLDEAYLLIERLVDTRAVCPCGVVFNLMTGRCEACDERHEQLTADRARFGVMALDIDENIGF